MKGIYITEEGIVELEARKSMLLAYGQKEAADELGKLILHAKFVPVDYREVDSLDSDRSVLVLKRRRVSLVYGK